MIHAGGLELGNKLCLAPLAGVTTLTIREFFSGMGAALTHTEMISCSGLIRDNAKTLDMLKVSSFESPLIVQLFAPDEKILYNGALKVLTHCEKFSGLGINMACPMPKITKNGAGSDLMRRPEIAAKMVKCLKNLNLPVWIKTRKFDNDYETLKFAELLINSGADNVCIHGRTPSQRYEGIADRSIISLAAKEFPGYISASGDVKNLADIDEYLNMGCVIVMIARGAFANPCLFEEYRGIYRTEGEKLDALTKFAYRTLEISGEHRAVVLLKRFAGSMLKFKNGAANLRQQAMMAARLEEILNIFRRSIY